MFNRLYGRERELIVSICKLPLAEAMDVIAKRYDAFTTPSPWGNVACFIDYIFLNYDQRCEVESLIRSGYFEQYRDGDYNGTAIRLIPTYSNYLEMEKDYDNQHKGGTTMFNKLYGKEREIVLDIYNKSDDEAVKLLCEKYSDESGSLLIMNELKSLATKGYVSGTLKSKTGIPGMKDILGNLHLTVLSDCRNYLEMEKDSLNNPKQAGVIFYGDINNSNVVAGNATNVNQTINFSEKKNELVSLLNGLRDSLLSSDDYLSEEEKEDLMADLDNIEDQVNSDNPKQSILKSAANRIGKLAIKAGVSVATATAATALADIILSTIGFK